jgi:aminopeptidase N
MLARQLTTHPFVAARVEAARALATDTSAASVEVLAGSLRSDKFWGVQAEAARALGRIRGDRAFAALTAATKVKHPKARAAVAHALGAFRSEDAVRSLAPLARKDVSYFVEAEAATAIGRTRAASAFDMLKKSMARESWNEVVRCGALAGFAELGDERAVPICLDWTKYGRHKRARRAAIGALAKLGEGRKDVREAIISLLDDRSFDVRISSVMALQTLHDIAALPALEAIAAQDVDGRLKRRCAEAIRAIREHAERPAELVKLRDEVVELRAQNRALGERIDRLEASGRTTASKNGRKAGAKRR